jgi:chaperonin cofactor prefoldin
MTSKSNPLPLNETLRDLAVLRATDADLAEILPNLLVEGDKSEVLQSVEKSYELVKEARDALRMYNQGKVEKQGERLEEVRERLEQVLEGLGEK